MTTITLPWPPSLNKYWRHPTSGKLAGRHMISAEGRAYRVAVQAECLVNRIKPAVGRLNVEITAFPPDKRTRDLDNLTKALLDGLTHGGAWGDDGQIDRLVIERAGVVSNGCVVVRISQRGAL
ncbi:RusA family crossover junction endodeoxyribonuclease [Silvimonas soli]|uniref:RusA family crossover junction endodeoxyribonuclease n=1 Tax=Silvimonas soli TaxID=2980100 RepID=UPI0024B32CE7|nr:RusA family crossover junction endodeoxyribonuclease [Silvimonas soli]